MWNVLNHVNLDKIIFDYGTIFDFDITIRVRLDLDILGVRRLKNGFVLPWFQQSGKRQLIVQTRRTHYVLSNNSI